MLFKYLEKKVNLIHLSDWNTTGGNIAEFIFTPKIIAANSFSIVTAAYNVARYLDDFFESLVNQTVSFEENIEVIIVDDGSSDETEDKIWEWIEKYPKNIKYFWQENAGQGAARNNGLTHAKHEWVTFIDPDDFISESYFENASSIIEANKLKTPLKLICASLIFYYEDKDKISDTHPLRFRFAKGDIVLPVTKPGKHINLNVTSNIFKRNRILQHGIRFDHEIKPGFEDSHFINSYLLTIDDGHMAFLKSAEYYYRKRDDGTSTLDTGWKHPGRYDHQLRLGSLGIIKKSLEKYGVVPEFIQRVALYDISWHLNKIIKKDADIYSLSPEKLELYKSLIHEILGHISVQTIMTFELAGIWFYHKLGLLGLFKGYAPDFNISYIDDVDYKKDLVRIRYFTQNSDIQERFEWDNKAAFPVYSKTRKHDFFGKCFINERIIWLRIGDTTDFTMETCGKPTRITLKGKQHRTGVKTQDIYAAFRPALVNESVIDEEVTRIRTLSRTPESVRRFGNCWLFMDRDNFADDNAEHLYRYVKNNQPKKKIYFILDSKSTDWARLENEGFNLIQLDSDEHKSALINAEHFISSHADQYIFAGIDKRNYGDLYSYKFTFLQHGVISCDLSHWLNTKEIDCFVTSTNQEYKSIHEDGLYKFTNKETVLTGLPRLDRLHKNKKINPRTILIMPTWRNSVVGKLTGEGNNREYNPHFKDSVFCQRWSAVLNSEVVKKISEKYEIVFYPHANIVDYIQEFDAPDFVKVQTQVETSIQDALVNAAILITDYSSVAFDFAYLDKIVYYYQFDAEEVLSGGHTYRPGYFDFKTDGFGPVSSELNELENQLEQFLTNGGTNSSEYLKRIQSTFDSDKGNNCKKTITAIENLTRSGISDSDYLASLTKQYNIIKKDEGSAELIGLLTLLHSKASDSDEYAIALAKSYRVNGDFLRASEWISKVAVQTAEVMDEKLEIAIAGGETSELNDEYFKLENHEIETCSDSHFELLMRYHITSKNLAEIDTMLSIASGRNSGSTFAIIAEAAMLLKRWDTAIEYLNAIYKLKPEDTQNNLMLAKAHMQLGNSTEAWKYVSNLPLSKVPDSYRIEFGRLAFTHNSWKQVVYRLEPLANDGSLSADDYLMLAKSQRKLNKLEASEISLSLASLASDQRTFLQEKALLLSAMQHWPRAIEAWELFLSRKDLKPNRDALLHLASCRLEYGQRRESQRDIERFEKMAGVTPQSLKLKKLASSI